MQVLTIENYILGGSQNYELAELLDYSVSSVKRLIRLLMQKYKARNRVQLAVKLMLNGFTPPDK